jgi:transketolase
MKSLKSEGKNNLNNYDLSTLAKYLRRDIIEISYIKKAHHIGSELSCIDILTILYFKVMNFNPKIKNKNYRDFFLLSKGHAALALYVTLCKKGFFSKNYLDKEFLNNGGKLGGHPDYNTSLGIEYSSGSLGHGISVGAGIALAKKKDKIPGNVYVLIGDGECNEGMIWEAILFGSSFNLDNLTVIVDFNNLQGLGKSNKIIGLDPLSKKFESFGWHTIETNGHNFEQLNKAFSKKIKNKPKIIIAKTIKGKGLISMQNKLSSHYETISSEAIFKKYLNEIK